MKRSLLLKFLFLVFMTCRLSAQEPGNALNFDGTNDYAYLPSQVNNPTTFTLEAWFKTTVKKGGIVGFNDSSTTSVGAYDRFIWMSSDGKINFSVHNGNGHTITTTKSYADGTYHHVAGTFTTAGGAGLKLYIDGVNVGAISLSTISNYNGYWKIGGLVTWGTSSGVTDYFQGSIDEVRIWNTVRTASEISANYKKVIPTSTPGLVSYLCFNQGTSGGVNTSITSLTNGVSSSNNGVLANLSLSGNTSNFVESYAMVVPSNLVTNAITGNSFVANWSVSQVGLVDNYLLDVSTSPTFATFLPGYSAKNVGNVSGAVVSGLTYGTNYYWMVRASKASVASQGGFAAEQAITTLFESLNISSTNTTNTFDLLTNSAKVVDDALAISYSQNINGFRVIISAGIQDGDVLSFFGTLPAGITATPYNPSTGVLAFSGSTSAANWQALLRTVNYRGFKKVVGNRTITFSAGLLNSASNGHFYEYVPYSGNSWTSAKNAAAAKVYLNYPGYLATITSAAENDYIKQILGANAWIGASDDFNQINAATGAITYNNQAAAEGKWHWITGPEAGTQFWNGADNGSSVPGQYANWNSGEPNNASGSQPEHMGIIYNTGGTVGKWNDVENGNTGIPGYIVEYGGMTNEIVQTPSYSVTMVVGSSSPGNALNFDGVNDYVILQNTVSNPTTFTLEAWFKTTVAKGGIVGYNQQTYNNNNSNQYDRFIWMGNDGKINFGVYNGTSFVVTSPLAYNDGKYHHVAASFATGNGNGMRLYIDGVLVGTNTAITTVTSYTGYWKIGGLCTWGNTNGDYFQGNIDEVRIWNVVRSADEIVNNYKKSISDTNNLALSNYFSFNQGVSAASNTGITLLYNQSNSTNNGVMNNFALAGTTSNYVESYAMVIPTAVAGSNAYSLGFTANWTAPTEGVVEKYLLDVSTNAAFTSYLPGFQAKDVGTATSYAITGLSNSTTYYYKVRAEKASVANTSLYSNVVSVSTIGKETVGVAAATNITTVGFRANFSAPAINDITSYFVDVASDESFTNILAGYNNLEVSQPYVNVTGLTPAKTYYYRVRVTGYNSNSSTMATTLSITATMQSAVTNSCVNYEIPDIVLTGSGSVAPYTFTYTLNGGSPQTVSSFGTSSSTSISVPFTVGVYTYNLINVSDAIGGSKTLALSSTITVVSEPFAGPVSGNLAVCPGNSTTLTVSDFSGNLQWQKASTIGGTYTDIANETSNILNTPPQNVVTYYRLKASNGVCLPEYSTPVAITIVPSVNYYADADGDGFGNAAVVISGCGAAPPGYVTNNTDCNDNNANVNPAHLEVYYNGIDDNCDGELDEGSKITTEINGVQCGTVLPTIHQSIGVNIVANATAYRFKVTNLTTSLVQTIERNLHWFRLTFLNTYEYNTTYSVAVEVQLNGVWLGYNGNICTISTPNITGAQAQSGVKDIQCGTTLPGIYSSIGANLLSGVTNYKFKVTNMTNALAPNAVQIIERPSGWFALNMLQSYNYGTTYKVEVAVKTTEDYGDYGHACTISTPAVPQLAMCGAAVPLDNAVVYTSPTSGVTQYRFEVKNLVTNNIVTVESNQHWFKFKYIEMNHVAGNAYLVRISVKVAGNWSDYGARCILNSGVLSKDAMANQSNEVMEIDSIVNEEAFAQKPAAVTPLFDTVASPNPFDNVITVDITTISMEAISIKVYDMTGKLVEQRSIASDSIKNITFGERYASGVYNVIVTQGTQFKSVRIIKR